MCGICGQICFDRQQQVDEHFIRRMAEVIAHRGPDESGVYVNGNVGLGHRRLSIIDLSTGQQPMSNARQDIWIVFNGEIYNFQDLRRDLEQRGYSFNSSCDTEVIIQLYDEYGTECVRYLRGMFAFALWDARRQRLFLARDRVGKKPLFYRHDANSFLFASEIKSLLQDATYTPQMNLTSMHHYLTYQYVPPPETMFQGIYSLPPAHTLVYENGRVLIDRYWNLSYTPKTHLSEPDILDALEHHLRDAVKLRMISDVPLGAFLSGGIDSSLVVALMSEYSSTPVKTFSIGFEEDGFNELPYARLIAERYQTEHHEFMVNADAAAIFPKLIWHFDEPCGDPAAIPTYYMAQMTGKHVKVVLNGDGGDESFAGYARYAGRKLVQWYSLLPRAFRQRALAPLFAAFQRHQFTMPAMLHHTLDRAKFLNEISLESRAEQYGHAMSVFPHSIKCGLYTEDLRRQLCDVNSLDYMLQYFHTEHTDHFTDAMMFSDIMTYLPGVLLVKVDRMTMAHSLEGRSPFLDHVLMEFAASLPAGLKFRRGQLKYLLKKLGVNWLPHDLLTRPKQGFSVPLGHWFRHELKEMLTDLFSTSALVNAGFFQQSALDRLVFEHQSGRRQHPHRLWLLLNLELWYRMFLRHE